MKDIKKLKEESETFCMLPFMHFYGSAKGDIVPCCEAQEAKLNYDGEHPIDTWNNDNFKNLRKALCEGKRVKACDVCWHNEDSGIVSNREQFIDDSWDEFKDLIEVDDDYTVISTPLWPELKVSNFCNLKCIMCSTFSSYKRTQDIDIISKYSSNYTTELQHPTELFDMLGEWPELWEQVKVLQFTGGEPIINQEHYDLLDSIPEEHRHKIRLRYATNISYLKYKKYDLLKIWRQFRSVNIKVSMDGVGDVYNYIREGGDWDTVYENICVLNDVDNITVAVGITVQAHNIFQMPEFYAFWKNSHVDLHFITANMLQTPNYLDATVWHGPFREAIIEKLELAEKEFPEMRRFINYMKSNEPNMKNYVKMRNYTIDIEERYKPNITLAGMVEKYLGLELDRII
jgi:MoaA/NifB/PqqE/SkfB family radical SAM enzyme